MDARWRLLPPFISITTSEKEKALTISAKCIPSAPTRAFRPECDRNWSVLPGIGRRLLLRGRLAACGPHGGPASRQPSIAPDSDRRSYESMRFLDVAGHDQQDEGHTGRDEERLAGEGIEGESKRRPGAMKPQVSTGTPPGPRTANPRIKAVVLPSYCCCGGLPAGRWLFVSSGHDQGAGPVVGTGANGVQRGTADPVVVTAQQQVRRSRASAGGRDDDRDQRPGRAAAGAVGVADGPGRSRRRIAGPGGTIAVMVREPPVHEATAQGGGTGQ